MKQTRRLIWFVLSTVLLCAILGGVYGRRVKAKSDSDDSDVLKSYHAFTNVYDVIEKNYADPVDPDGTLLNGTWMNPSLTLTLSRLCGKTRKANTMAWECRFSSGPEKWAS